MIIDRIIIIKYAKPTKAAHFYYLKKLLLNVFPFLLFAGDLSDHGHSESDDVTSSNEDIAKQPKQG